MDTKKLQQIAERCNNATAGPWYACHTGKCKCGIIWSIPEDTPVCTNAVDNNYWIKIDGKQKTCNAEFIANARVDIPELLDHIKYLQAQILLEKCPQCESLDKLVKQVADLEDLIQGLEAKVKNLEAVKCR